MKSLSEKTLTEFDSMKAEWFDLTDTIFKEIDEYKAKLKSITKRYQKEKAKSSSRLDNTNKTIQSITSKMEDSIKIIANDICNELGNHTGKFEKEVDLIKYDYKQRNVNGKHHIQVFEEDFNEFIKNSSRRHYEKQQ